VTAVVQATALVLVAVGGLAVVLTRDPVRQTLVASVYGILLAVLFLAFQAPDVALSQIVVSALAVPAMILLALARIHEEKEE
jgi:uncharacterized MnhB-related membrane protein